MGSVFKHLFRVGAAAGVALALSTACETNNQSLVITGAIPPTVSAGVCTFTPSDTTVSNPTMDVAFSDTYVIHAAVLSQFVDRANKDVPRAESNSVSVTGAEVRVTDGLGGELGAFTTLVSTTIIPPAATGSVPITVVAPSIAARLRNELKLGERRQLVIFAKVFGQTLGNKSIESGEYQFVMTAVKGALITFPTDTDDPSTPGRDCNIPTKDKTIDDKVCAVGSDAVFTCTLCRERLGITNPLCAPPP
ncbi:MAG: hypothetical protein HOO96_11715 [Polyangiaceae bacterium]|nr:hypothetical protein [Polyangiaceae bacterium]